MYKIINEIATIEYEVERRVISVDFQERGHISKYEQAIEIAQLLAINRNTNRWLFVKNNFSDLSTDEFLFFVNTCYQRFFRLSLTCKLAVYSKPQAFEKLVVKYAWLKKEEEALSLGIFKSKSNAYRYLSEVLPVSPRGYSLSSGPEGHIKTVPAEYHTTDREKAAILR